jgi:hypothetical protein
MEGVVLQQRHIQSIGPLCNDAQHLPGIAEKAEPQSSWLWPIERETVGLVGGCKLEFSETFDLNFLNL